MDKFQQIPDANLLELVKSVKIKRCWFLHGENDWKRTSNVQWTGSRNKSWIFRNPPSWTSLRNLQLDLKHAVRVRPTKNISYLQSRGAENKALNQEQRASSHFKSSPAVPKLVQRGASELYLQLHAQQWNWLQISHGIMFWTSFLWAACGSHHYNFKSVCYFFPQNTFTPSIPKDNFLLTAICGLLQRQSKKDNRFQLLIKTHTMK